MTAFYNNLNPTEKSAVFYARDDAFYYFFKSFFHRIRQWLKKILRKMTADRQIAIVGSVKMHIIGPQSAYCPEWVGPEPYLLHRVGADTVQRAAEWW